MSVITTHVVKHNGDVVWYPIFQVSIIVGCSSIYTGVVAVISYLSIFRVIELFEADGTLFCCLVFSIQHIGKFYHGLPWKCFIQPLYHLYVFYELFQHSPYLGTFLNGQGHLHRLRCCVHTILTEHVCLSFPCMVPFLFSQSSLY